MRTVAILLLLSTALLAGCSDEPAADPADAAQEPAPVANATMPMATILEASAEGLFPVNPTLDPAELTVASGAMVMLTFTNNDVNPLISHDWVLEGIEGAATASIAPGDSTAITFTAPAPGDYAFYCDIGNHRGMGMEGVLHVTA